MGYEVKRIDCCVKKCVAFTGIYANLEECSCGEPRFQPLRQPLRNNNRNDNGPGPRRRTLVRKPRKTFFYFPIIPRLLLQYANPDRFKLMQRYVSEQTIYSQTRVVSDFCSGKLCEDLKMREYFQDSRAIALSIMGDGMSLTRQRHYTCFVCK